MAQSDELNSMQEKFCQFYVGDCKGIATQSAIKAGYSIESAHVTGCRMLKLTKVKNRIEELERDSIAALGATRDKVMAEFVKLAFVSLADYFISGETGKLSMIPIEEWTEAMRASVKKFKLLPNGTISELELHGKTEALAHIAKIMGYLVDRTEHLGGIAHHFDLNNMKPADVFSLLEMLEAEPKAKRA